MLWLALHFPRLPMEVFTIGQAPWQAGGQTSGAPPLVVLEDNRVSLMNDAAEQGGLVPGATLATAHSILPELRYRHRDPQQEQQRLRSLADVLYGFSGYVSLQAPDCVLLEIGGSLKLFGCHQQLADDAAVLCRQHGHAVNARVAHTPWAAIALARSGCRQLADVPLTDAGLELAGVKDAVVERFANMGIYTLGPLLNLPGKSLGKRFGKPLLRYLAQLTGDLADPREAVTPARYFRRARHLLSPLQDKQQVCDAEQSPMRQLAAELQHWLVARQLGCESLTWHFESHDSRQQASVSVRFAKGQQNATDIMRISALQLARTDLPEEVLSVALRTLRVQPWRGNSGTLFQHTGLQAPEKSPEDADGATSSLLDEFTARLGAEACRYIRALPQHTPESAWRFDGIHAAARATRPAPVRTRRPLWLFDPPRRVAREALELLQGPERIQSQWWQLPATCRDYYIVQHCSGVECWAFVDEQSQWYLHGYFG